MAGDIYFQASAEQVCNTFMDTPQAKKQEVSVVITPLKVIEDGKQIKAVYGCNRWKACHDPTCQYSIASRGETK